MKAVTLCVLCVFVAGIILSSSFTEAKPSPYGNTLGRVMDLRTRLTKDLKSGKCTTLMQIMDMCVNKEAKQQGAEMANKRAPWEPNMDDFVLQ